MNQEKIGKFIQEKRREKNITQSDLANKLGVSGKTVSNWETGRNMPDLSLFKPLCSELDISINDLMNGEIVDKKNYQDKLEETIINTIDYKDKNNNRKIIRIVIFIIILFIVLLGVVLFKSNSIQKPQDNYPVYPAVEIEKEKYDSIIRHQISSNLNSTYYDDGKWFIEYKVYSIEDIGNDFYYVYTWVLEAEYSYQNGILKEGSGSSYPCRFELHNKNGIFSVFSKSIPRDGNYYSKDMEKYFPEYVRYQVYKDTKYDLMDELSISIKKQAKEYYKIK